MGALAHHLLCCTEEKREQMKENGEIFSVASTDRGNLKIVCIDLDFN